MRDAWYRLCPPLQCTTRPRHGSDLPIYSARYRLGAARALRYAVFDWHGRGAFRVQRWPRNLDWEQRPPSQLWLGHRRIQQMPHRVGQFPPHFFFRVRTPCGRCAQVIVEEKETLHIDGGSKPKPPTPKTPNKKPKTSSKTNTRTTTAGPQSMWAVFPLY